MPPAPSAGKARASRIPLDYYKRGDRLKRLKQFLGGVAAVVAIGWAYWGLAFSPRQHSPGEVSSSHLMWDSQCSACHDSFQPIGSDAIQLTSDRGRTDNKRCQSCHVGAEHHRNLMSGEATNCAVCHREHRGRNASMTQVDDHACVVCHVDSRDHARERDKVVQFGEFASHSVTAFGVGTHPQFPAIKEDPGRLKFSHRRHLMQGQKLGPADRTLPKLLKDLPEDLREKYRLPGQEDDDEVQLSCISCHRNGPVPSDVPNLADFGTAPATQPTNGAYVLPISYEKHCRACHPIEFFPNSELNRELHTVPHGLDPQALKQAVRGAVLDAYVTQDQAFESSFKPTRTLPQKPPPTEARAIGDWANEKVTIAEKIVSDRCAQCHELTGPATERPVEHTNIQLVWYNAAKFDHGSHRAIECKACHAGAYDYQTTEFKTGDSLLDHKRIMLPGIEVCAECHAPRRSDGSGGARFDCIECHRFHGADLKPSDADQASHRLDEKKKTDMKTFLHGRW